MRIDHPERLVLLAEIAGQLDQDKVLEDVGMVAGMESVAITEHDGPLKTNAPGSARYRTPGAGS